MSADFAEIKNIICKNIKKLVIYCEDDNLDDSINEMSQFLDDNMDTITLNIFELTALFEWLNNYNKKQNIIKYNLFNLLTDKNKTMFDSFVNLYIHPNFISPYRKFIIYSHILNKYTKLFVDTDIFICNYTYKINESSVDIVIVSLYFENIETSELVYKFSKLCNKYKYDQYNIEQYIKIPLINYIIDDLKKQAHYNDDETTYNDILILENIMYENIMYENNMYENFNISYNENIFEDSFNYSSRDEIKKKQYILNDKINEGIYNNDFSKKYANELLLLSPDKAILLLDEYYNDNQHIKYKFYKYVLDGYNKGYYPIEYKEHLLQISMDDAKKELKNYYDNNCHRLYKKK